MTTPTAASSSSDPTNTTTNNNNTNTSSTEGPSHAWEDTTGDQTWENGVREDADGNLILAGTQRTQAEAIRLRRQRLHQNDYAQRNRQIVRDMIRYLYIVVDASSAMRVKDPVLPPGNQTRLEVVTAVLQDFVSEYYDQNPLSHLGFVLVRNGEAEILSQLSSSSKQHRLALQSVQQQLTGTKGGEFSLQNGLEVAGRSLGHQPKYGSREIVVLCGSLHTCDPGNLLTETLPKLLAANVRVSCLALAAEIHVCRRLADETHGTMGVCLDKTHLREWLLQGQCVPPPHHSASSPSERGCDMVRMGFPTRTMTDVPTLVHATQNQKTVSRESYSCPQCQAKNAELPSTCAVCGLKLVLSPHLARSFHHLFPVPPFGEVAMDVSLMTESIVQNDEVERINKASASPHIASSSSANGPTVTVDSNIIVQSTQFDRCCYGCLKIIGVRAMGRSDANKATTTDGEGQDEGEEVLRFQCPDCRNVFCSDCDAFLHETLHNCPGCLLRS